MKLKPYSKMKDSGIEWIGKIPEVWTLKKARFFIIIHGSYAQFTEYENGISYFKVDDLNYTSQNLMLEDSETKVISKGKPIPKLSILIPKRGEAINTNKVVISKTECYFDSNVMGLEILSSFSTKFVAYFLLSRTLSDLVDKTTIPQINNKHIKPLVFSFPQSCIEQEQIAQFLDTQTNKLDSEISKNQKLINLLKEKRQSIINHVITKGLDPTVQMKNSGIDWIGKIPEHWDIKKLKFSTSVSTKKSNITTNSLSYVGLENIEPNTTKLISVNDEMEESEAKLFVKDNVLFGKLRPYLSKVWVADFDGRCTSEFLILKGLDYESNFLKFFLISDRCIQTINSSTYGAKMPRAEWSFIGNMRLPIPKKDEQKKIIDFLDKQISEMDSLRLNIELQIKKLQEFRQSLISSAVTGKIDLRNYSISA